jgi:hypothetical protein
MFLASTCKALFQGRCIKIQGCGQGNVGKLGGERIRRIFLAHLAIS